MTKLKALYALATSAKFRSQFHALITAVLAIYTVLKGAGV